MTETQGLPSIDNDVNESRRKLRHMVKVLVPKITPRVQYTMDFVFKARELSYELVTELSGTEEESILVYGLEKIDGYVHFAACELLFEDTIGSYSLEKMEVDHIEMLSFNGVTDVFASIFFVLSRYEEYLGHPKDEHGRFRASASLQMQYGWMEKCICDRWAEAVLSKLNLVPDRSLRMIPSFDIDNTFAYKLKLGKQRFLSSLRDILKRDVQRIQERRRVEQGGHDPYDTFARIREIVQTYELTRVFWLIAPTGPKDRNISIKNTEHQELIRKMDDRASVGLHPGYASNGSSQRILSEKQALEKVLGHSVEHSRQHFLRFNLPNTYQALEICGFRHEYSMGYAECLGFRNGTGRPFPWFDLGANRISELIVHPFAYMDGTLNEYMHLSIPESKIRIAALYQEMAAFGGDFVFIWHNETVGNYKKWKGWSEVLDFTLNLEK